MFTFVQLVWFSLTVFVFYHYHSYLQLIINFHLMLFCIVFFYFAQVSGARLLYCSCYCCILSISHLLTQLFMVLFLSWFFLFDPTFVSHVFSQKMEFGFLCNLYPPHSHDEDMRWVKTTKPHIRFWFCVRFVMQKTSTMIRLARVLAKVGTHLFVLFLQVDQDQHRRSTEIVLLGR